MILRLDSLSKTYSAGGRPVHALRNCSLTIEDRSFTVIAGRSGCGKTTLLKIIAGLEKADTGTVEFSDVPGGPKLSSPKLGFMFQDPRLLPWLTVEENLALAFKRPREWMPRRLEWMPRGLEWMPRAKTEKSEQAETIRQTLGLTGLSDWAAAYPRQLSGGMAQRAALARCLCRKPSLLLLDEPLGSLDAFTRIRLRGELERLWQDLGLTVILVSHDIEEAVFFGSQVMLMKEGSMVSQTSIPLKRPRDYRGREFQDYCRTIEEALCNDPA